MDTRLRVNEAPRLNALMVVVALFKMKPLLTDITPTTGVGPIATRAVILGQAPGTKRVASEYLKLTRSDRVLMDCGGCACASVTSVAAAAAASSAIGER